MKNGIITIIVILIFLCFSCGNTNDNTNRNSYPTPYKTNGYQPNQSAFSASISVPNYLYERTYSSDYKYNYKEDSYYNYDISGYDGNGNYVTGNVDIDENGDGYIYDENGDAKYIEVEWSGYGVMEGYDEDGVYYELEVE